jgi:hypothetical protein
LKDKAHIYEKEKSFDNNIGKINSNPNVTFNVSDFHFQSSNNISPIYKTEEVQISPTKFKAAVNHMKFKI